MARRNTGEHTSPKDAVKKLSSPSMRYVLKIVVKNYWLQLIFVIIAIIVSAIATVRGTLFIQTMVDDYILPLVGDPDPDFGPLAKAMLKIAVVYIIGIVASWAHARIMVNVGQGSLREIRCELFSHMEKLPIRYFDTHSHGDIMSIYTNDTDTMRQFIGQSFPQLINSLVTIVSTFVSMCIISVPLALLTTLLVIAVLIISGKLATLSGKYYSAQQKNLGAMNGYIEEMMSGQRVIKVFTHEDSSIEKFNELDEQLRSSANNANGIANILMPVAAQLGNVNYVIIAVVGAICAINGFLGITVGKIISFMTLSKSFSRPFTQLSMELNTVAQASAGAERIYALITEESESDDGYVTLANIKELDGHLIPTEERTGSWAWCAENKSLGMSEKVKLEGDIIFDEVDFSYDGKKQILFDVSLYAHKGQKIAFVGSTGAGKTTITNLLNRFYDIQDGKIRYDGININYIKKDDLRSSLGVVLQDTHLFTGTVMDNIRYGRLEATDEECKSAAKLANADFFIKNLPQGYDTMLTGDGGSLSQGQKQLIAIARAAVADPPVLVLDEATSSIDTRTEQLVQKGMDSLMAGRTTFVIAHRLSTVKNADCIMVMEKGRIIERGSHDELIALQGKYYQLYTGSAPEAV